jgi:hypothetical protein
MRAWCARPPRSCYRWGVDDHHARAGRGSQVDPVGLDAGLLHDGEPRRRSGQELGIDSRLRADHQGVPTALLAQRCEQVGAGKAGSRNRFVRRGQNLDPGRGHRLGDQDASHALANAGG